MEENADRTCWRPFESWPESQALSQTTFFEQQLVTRACGHKRTFEKHQEDRGLDRSPGW